jgi:hypothetical protein
MNKYQGNICDWNVTTPCSKIRCFAFESNLALLHIHARWYGGAVVHELHKRATVAFNAFRQMARQCTMQGVLT